MAAWMPRVQLAGPRGILAARAPAAERAVGADDPERKRSGFRAPRREMRPSPQTASQVGVIGERSGTSARLGFDHKPKLADDGRAIKLLTDQRSEQLERVLP
jgi:hypothetical protein